MKFKILLLGGIITLFGIFNYSSAVNQTITIFCDSSSCSPNSITFPSNLTSRSDISMSYSNLSIEYEEYGQVYLQVEDEEYDKYLSFDAWKTDDSVICEDEIGYCQTDCESYEEEEINQCMSDCNLLYQECMSSAITYDASFESRGIFVSNVPYVYDGGFPGTVNLSFTFDNGQSSGGGNEGGNEGGSEGGSEGSVIVGGFGSLTPAISGLWESVSQLIPLVVYIGIGVLLAIIGFFVIRWLLNRLNGKINGYFSSKRG